MSRNHHIDRYMQQISKTPLLTPQEEVELAGRIKRGDMTARDQMVKANLLLVAKIAYDYVKCGLPLEDLIAEGNVGLIKAVERFDPNKGGKLSTYAAWWIKQCIKRALANQGRTIRVPVHAQDKFRKLERIRNNLTVELGRTPSLEEMSELTGITAEKLSALEEIAQTTSSLDAPAGGEEGGRETVGDLVEDRNAVRPDEAAAKSDLINSLGPVVAKLDERERKILELRFGLAGQSPMTLGDIGKRFGVTRERIRQLQNIALASLKYQLSLLEDPKLCAAVEILTKRTEKREDAQPAEDPGRRGSEPLADHCLIAPLILKNS